MNNAEKLIEFIADCPDASFGARHICKELDDYGFERLYFHKPFKLKRGGSYYAVKNSSCIIAFTVGQNIKRPVYKIAAAHLDSPAFKIKRKPTVSDKGYIRLSCESYGGLVTESWFDRPLSFAGRLIVTGERVLKPTEIYMDFKRPMLIIPSLAPHLGCTDKSKPDLQKEAMPIGGILTEKEEFDFETYIAKEARVPVTNILDYEFTVYNAEKGVQLGFERDFISAPRLDDLLMVFCMLEVFKKERSKDYINVALFTDHEEVGSLSAEGAKSSFMGNMLKLIASGLDFSEADNIRGLEDSLGVSADAAHGYHPAYPEKQDITSFPVLNGGLVIKYSSSKSYSTEIYSASVIREICKDAAVPVQTYFNRAGVKGGSTIGSLLSSQLGFSFTDIGMGILSMHSAREICGTKDVDSGISFFKAYYSL